MAATVLAAVMGTTAAAEAVAAPASVQNSGSTDTAMDGGTRASESGSDSGLFRDETFHLSAKPSPAAEQDRLKSTLQLSSAQSTGMYLRPNRIVLLEVADTPESRAGNVKVRIGVPGAERDGGGQRVITLKPGANRFGDRAGGMLYVSVEGKSSTATSVRMFGSGLLKAPRFVLGTTSNEEFRKALDTSRVPWAEYVSERAIVTVDRATALKHRDTDPYNLMSTYDAIIRVQDGVNNVGTGHKQLSPSPLIQHVTLDGRKKNAMAQASHGYMAFDPAHADVLLSAEKLSKGETAWDIWRELSRPRQLKPVSGDGLSEALASVYAVPLERYFAHPVTFHWIDLRLKHTRTLAKLHETNPSLDSVRGAVMLDQLTIAYGQNYWSRVNDLILRDKPKQPRTARDTLILTASVTANEDLRGFFAKSGLVTSASADKILDSLDLRKPKTDPSALGDGTPKNGDKVSIAPLR